MAEKNRYSDAELQEFKELILKKLEKAQKDYEMYKSSITHGDGNDTMDTSPTFKVLEEGAATLSKEEAGKLAQRQLKFIKMAKNVFLWAKDTVIALSNWLSVISEFRFFSRFRDL